MEVSELAAVTTWDDIDLGHVTLVVPMLVEEVEFVLFPQNGTSAAVTEKMATTVNDVLALQPSDLQRVKYLLWEEANFTFTVADYGVEPDEGESSLDAHLREFEISDAEDAFTKSRVKEIQIFDGFASRFAQVKIVTGTDTRIAVIVKDGRIIDYDDDGTNLSWFEDDELHAQRKRARVLATD